MLNTSKVIGLALVVGALAGCSPGGGGGGDAKRDAGNDAGDQLRANLTVDLTNEARDFAEAYARVPWIHANLAAGDWERALDDLQFLDQQVNDINQDDDVAANVKARIMTVKPQIATLNRQIQAHDRAALATAAKLGTQFSQLTNEREILAFMGQRVGGGAGR